MPFLDQARPHRLVQEWQAKNLAHAAATGGGVVYRRLSRPPHHAHIDIEALEPNGSFQETQTTL
jgi:hypothetical protein